VPIDPRIATRALAGEWRNNERLVSVLMTEQFGSSRGLLAETHDA
jgi:hypothetical protein